MTTSPTGHGDPSYDRYARMVCRALGVSTATVTMIGGDRQHFVGGCGLPEELDLSRETPLSHSFCQHVVLDRAPLIVSDAREHDVLRTNPAIQDLNVVSYAGWPITDHTGAVVGSLCALGDEPRVWTDAQIEMLEDLAAACSAEVAQRGLRANEEALAHRSRVLLALSDGLSGTNTLADVARAIERIALEQLGCLHAGVWLRPRLDRADPAPEVLTFIESPDNTWESARRNGSLPLDESNPLGRCIVRGVALHYASKDVQNQEFPHLDVSAQVGDTRSFVPLRGRRRVLGTLALVWADRHVLSDEDRLTIDALTSYSAQAVRRALLVQERTDALVTLQSSLLSELPEPDGLHLAARYRPAARRDQVGGDWYDAVVVPSGATSIMVGDVVGHDLEAAAVMGQLRHMLRAIAWAVDDAPSHNVARLDEAMVDLAIDGMATLVYARVEPRGGPDGREVRWTNAGHPPPLLVTADGAAAFLDDGPPDLMVGVQPGTERTDRSTRLPSGSTLLLYTDGLVERRGESISDGLDRLVEAARSHHGLGVDDFLDAVLGDLVGRELADDVAVLAVHVRA